MNQKNYELSLKEETTSENTLPERLTELTLESEQLAAIVASNVPAPPELLKKLAANDSDAVK